MASCGICFDFVLKTKNTDILTLCGVHTVIQKRDFMNYKITDLLKNDDSYGQNDQNQLVKIVEVISEEGSIKNIPTLIKNFSARKVFVFADEKSYRLTGQQIEVALAEEKIEFSHYIFKSSELNPGEKNMDSALLRFDPSCDMLITVATKELTDTVKAVAGLAGKPCMIVGAAASESDPESSESDFVYVSQFVDSKDLSAQYSSSAFLNGTEEELSKIIYTLFFDVTAADKRVIIECDSVDVDTKKHIAAFLYEIVPEYFHKKLSVNISDSYFSPSSRINIISNGVNYDIDNNIFVIGYSNGKLSVKSDLNYANEILRCLSSYFAQLVLSSIDEYIKKTRTYADFTSKLHGSDLNPFAAFTAAAIPNLGVDISPEMTGLELLNEYDKVFANINRANIKGAWINNEKTLNKLIGISVKKVFAANNQNDINNLAAVLYDFTVPNGNESGPVLCAAVLDEFYGKDGCSDAVRSAFSGLKVYDSEKALKVLKCLDNPAIYKELPEKPSLEYFEKMCGDACNVYTLSLYGDEQLAIWLFEFFINDSFKDFKPLDNYNKFLGTAKYHELLEAVKAQIIEFLPAVEPEDFVAVAELYEYALKNGDPDRVPQKPLLADPKNDTSQASKDDIANKAKALYDMWAKDNASTKEDDWGKLLNRFWYADSDDEKAGLRRDAFFRFFKILTIEDAERAKIVQRGLSNPDAFECLPEKLTVDVFWKFAVDDFKAASLTRASAGEFAECFYNEPQAVDNENLELIFKSFCQTHIDWCSGFINNTLLIFYRELEAVAGNPANAAEMAELRKKAVDLQKRLPLLKLVLDTAKLVGLSSDNWRSECYSFIKDRINSFVIREAEKVVWGNILGFTYVPEYVKKDKNTIDYSKTGKKVSFVKIREIGAAIDRVSSKKKNKNTEYDNILNQRLDEYSDSQYIYDSVRSLTDFLLGKKFSNTAHGMRAALLMMIMFDPEKTKGKYRQTVNSIFSAVKKSSLENRKNFGKDISDIARILFRFIDADDNEWNIIRKRISEYNPEIYSLLVNAKPDVFENYAERSAGYAGESANQFRINVPGSGSGDDEPTQSSQQVNTPEQINGPELTVSGDDQNRGYEDKVGNSGSKKRAVKNKKDSDETGTRSIVKTLVLFFIMVIFVALIAWLYVETRVLWSFLVLSGLTVLSGVLYIICKFGKFRKLNRIIDIRTAEDILMFFALMLFFVWIIAFF